MAQSPSPDSIMTHGTTSGAPSASLLSSSTSTIMLGCTVAVVSSAIQSLGITLQRKSHLLACTETPAFPAPDLHNSTVPTHKQLQRQKRNLWLFGFLLFIIANILGSVIQISTLPLIILSPLQSIGLIFNSVLSCLLLPGEKFTQKLGVGTVVIALGAFTIAYNGNGVPSDSIPNIPPPTSIDERFALIMDKLLRPAFMGWFIATFVLCLALLVFNRFVLARKIKSSPKKVYGLNIGNKYQFLKGVNYGIISGALTAHTFLFAKSIVDVIIETLLSKRSGGKHSWLPVADSTPYILLAIMLSIIGLQLTAFNLGLKHISTSILYPLCFLIYNMFNLINDITFNSLLAKHLITYIQFAWIICGLVAVLCGVVVISWDSAFGGTTTENEAVGQCPGGIHTLSERTKLFDNCDDDYGANNTLDSDESDHRLTYEQNQLLHSMDL